MLDFKLPHQPADDATVTSFHVRVSQTASNTFKADMLFTCDNGTEEKWEKVYTRKPLGFVKQELHKLTQKVISEGTPKENVTVSYKLFN